MPSVVPRVKMISCAARALMNFAHAFARGFVGAGGAIAQFVNAAVDIGVVVLVVAADGIEDGARLLRGGGVVEVDERMAVDLLIEDREVGAEPPSLSRRLGGAGSTDERG